MKGQKWNTYLLIAILFSCQVFAEQEVEKIDPFAFLADEDRPTLTIWDVEYPGFIDVSSIYTFADSFTFGRYNGLSEEGAKLNLSGYYRDWQVDSPYIDYWQVNATNLGLDNRQISLQTGLIESYKLKFSYHESLQVNNFTGQSPYAASTSIPGVLSLPPSWVAAQNTSDMTAFNNTASPFAQTVERERLHLDYLQYFSKYWHFTSHFSSENKTGTKSTGAAFYANTQNGHAVILPQAIDQKTHKVNASVRYQKDKYTLTGDYLFSQFENQKNSLMWQNPYSSMLGPYVAFPNGIGQIGVEPDNDFHQLRLFGHYIYSPELRFTGDASYSIASQNDDFLPYTSNNQLSAGVLPRTGLDGEVITITAKGAVFYRYSNNVTFNGLYRFKERENQSPRDAYQGVFADTWAPLDENFRLYNVAHSKTTNYAELQASYTLPNRNKLALVYGYEEIDRYNYSVNTTRENTIKIKLRSRSENNLASRFELGFKERYASLYRWDHSYFSLFDAALINQTPENQRYSNHPLLSQYFLSNREQLSAKANFSFPVNNNIQTNLDIHYQENDYDKSTLGLTSDRIFVSSLNGMWLYSKTINFSSYLAYDSYEFEQSGREFTGGYEKSAFDLFEPLPQASDPSRNWQIKPADSAITFGVTAHWDFVPKTIAMDLDYRFSDSTSKHDDFSSGGAVDLTNIGLPDAVNKEHHFEFTTLYHYKPNMSFSLSYQYYRFDGKDWAYDWVGATSLDKILGTGQQSANEKIHIVQLSFKYQIE